MAVIDVKEEFVLYSWNLTHDYDLEQFPDEIARCLKTALLAEHSNSKILPHYTDFYKSGMIVSVEVSTLPVPLRHVIGNRQEMQEYGATLMKSLIQGYTTLKKSTTVMRGLQPSMIFVSEDATQVQFADILSMARWDSEPKHQIRSTQPYSAVKDWSENGYPLNCPTLDMHSLGVILLEIIAGTDVLLSCRCKEALEGLINDC